MIVGMTLDRHNDASLGGLPFGNGFLYHVRRSERRTNGLSKHHVPVVEVNEVAANLDTYRRLVKKDGTQRCSPVSGRLISDSLTQVNMAEQIGKVHPFVGLNARPTRKSQTVTQ